MKKVLGILICILLITTMFPLVQSSENPMVFSMMQPNNTQSSSLENWIEIQKLLTSDGAAYDQFGISVSLYGDYALIGSMGDNIYGYASGSAYIFKRSGSSWIQEAKLLPSDGTTEDVFGLSVSLNGDYALIGAPQDDDNGASSGSAYIFKHIGSTWVQEAKLLPLDGESWDYFGHSVSVYGDYALIGSYNDDDNGDYSGSAYVFKCTGSSWTQEAKLLPLDGETGDNFGLSVSLYSDYALIGSLWDDDYGDSSGSAYIFKRTGSTWTQEAKLLPLDGESGDSFGKSVSLFNDYALIGAFYDDDNGYLSGSAYIFKHIGSSWVQEAKLRPSDGEAGESFGYSVSLYAGNALIGVYADDDNGQNSGSAYVFKCTGSSWIQDAKLLPSDGTTGDYCGHSVSLYGDYAFIGAPWHDDNGDESGSVYVFTRESENHPPNSPVIDGPTSGDYRVAHQWNFTATDPDNDNIFYYVDWGDGTNTGWSLAYNSGETMPKSHRYDAQGSYTITAKAKDIYGAESGWGQLSVTMPYKPEPSPRPLFLLYIYAVGDSASSMSNITGGFRFNLPFEFITNESYVRVTWGLFSSFPWEEWNITGPEKYNAFLFFGSVHKVHDKYIIEGRCLRLDMYT